VRRVAEEYFFLQRSSPLGLQAQLREIVISGILNRSLPTGAMLPSTRRLAGHLGIARMTVTLAYQELAAQGFVEPCVRRGYKISDNAEVVHSPIGASDPASEKVDWARRLQGLATVHRGVEKPSDWRRYPLPFVYGQMDMSLFSHNAWRDCSRRALGRRDFETMAGDAASADDDMLVDYICRRTLPIRGIHVSPSQVLVTLGAQNALWIATQLLLDRQRHGVHENPCHPDILATLRMTGARLTAVAVDAAGLPPSQVPPDADVVYATPSHQSPTTVTMPIARRLELLGAAEASDFVIVEDDYEFEMSYLRQPSPAFKALDRHDRVIYVGSFSKSLFPGLRLGYLVASCDFIERARALRSLMLRHPPGHLQRTTAYFLALGHYEVLIRKMRSVFHERYRLIVETFAAEGLEIAISSTYGGSSLWVEGPPGLDADRLASLLLEDGVVIEPGTPFFAFDCAACRCFRLGFSSIPTASIPQGIRLIAQRMRELAKPCSDAARAPL